MARRLTAEEKQRLLEEDFWSRYNREREQFAAAGADTRTVSDLEQNIFDISQRPSFSNVSTASPFETAEPESFVRAQDRPARAGMLGDTVIDATSSAIDIGAGLVDAFAPDPNRLSADPTNPFQNALQNAIDTGLRIPTIIDDTARSVVSRLAPNASPEAVDAVFSTINPYAAGARAQIAEREAQAGTPFARPDTGANAVADELRGVANVMREQRSPEAKAAGEALAQAVDSGAIDTAKFLFTPEGLRAGASVAAGSAPYAGLGFGVGTAGRLAGLSATAATAGAGATTFATLASNNAAQAEQAILSLSDEEASILPGIAEMMAGGMTLEQAKQRAASSARFSTIAAMAPAAPLYGSGLFERMGGGHRANVLATLRGRTAAGTAREVATETIQEGSERFASNVGEIAGGVRSEDDRFEGIAGSALLGGAAAGPLAAGASYASARGDFDNRAQALLQVADVLERRAQQRAATRDTLEQAQFEEQAMERLAANDAQREFISQPGTPAADNAGRPVEPFEAYAAREGAEVLAAEEAQRAFLAQNTLESSNAALQNSLRESPRGVSDAPLTGTRASRAAENQRLAQSVIAEQLDQAAFEEETMGRLATREAALTEARDLDSTMSAAEQRAAAAAERRTQTARAASRRAHLASVREANKDATPEVRAAAIADAAIAWDQANATAPEAAPVAAPAAAPAPRTRTSRVRGTGAVGASPALSEADVAELGLTPEDLTAAPTGGTTEEREAALRASFAPRGATRADASESSATPRAASSVIRELASRVRSGNDSEALAQEQLLKNGKLVITDGDQMAALAPEAPNARGYYDGERMYINAARIPEGNATGAVLNEILAHEADHAARLSGNADAKSRVRTLLGDGQTEKLIEQLRTSNHRDAVAAREFVSRMRIDEATDPQRYEDELTAYAVTSAVRNANNDRSLWAPIRGMVSAARRKMKQFTGSDNINLEDIAGYAQDVINALATSEQDIELSADRQPSGRADATGQFAYAVEELLASDVNNKSEMLMDELARDESLPEHERKLAERLAPLMTQFNVQLRPASENARLSSDPSRAAGMYSGGLNTMYFNSADSITILHEGLHAVTRNLLAQRAGVKDIPRLNELRTEFDDMLEALRAHAAMGGLDRFPQGVRNLFNADGGPLSSTWELLSYGMTEPDVQAVLSEIEAPSRSKFANMWQWFKNAISKFYGNTAGERSFLDQLIENTGALVEFANTNPGAVRRVNDNAADQLRRLNQPGGWADDSADAPALPSHAFAPNKFSETVRDAVKNAVTWHGAEGEKAALLIEQSEGLLNSFYSHALSFSNRTTRGIELAASKLAKKEGISKKEALTKTEAMLERRLANIRKLPSQATRDRALTNLVNEYPDLLPVQQAIEAINAFTKQLIAERMADPTPLTEQEVETYEFMARNQSGYLTNTYALFQGAAGKEYANRLASLAQKGYDALAENREIPKEAREEFRVYDNALKFVIANDVAVNDPEMLAAMSMEDVTNIHDMWAPAGQKASDIRTRMQNNGTYAQETFKDVMADRVIDWVNQASPEEIDAHGKIVVNTLLRLNDMSGPAKRYAKASGIDTSILKHLQGVPEPIAELYGRIEDVPTLLLTTVTEMGELAARSELFNNIRKQGYGTMVVSLRDRAQNPEQYEEFRIPLSGDSYGPLQGLYTTEAMARALSEYNEGFTTLLENVVDLGTIGKGAGVFMNAVDAVGKPLAKLNSAYKAMAIPTRIDYLLLNAIGSMTTPLLVGGVSPTNLVTGFKVAAKAIANTLDPEGTWHDATIDFDSNLAAAMGVMENVVLQDIRQQPRKLVQQFIEDIGNADDASGIAAAFKKAKEYGGRGWNAWLEAFAMSDAWVRYPVALQRMDFLRDYYQANGETVTNQRLMNEAAAYAKDVTMTASRAPGVVRGAERRGLTMYGNYLFNVPRVIAMNGKAIFDSFKMARDATTEEAHNIAMADGLKKTLGFSTMIGALTYGIKAAADALMDDDDREQLERDRAFLAAPTGELAENQYADLVYVGKDDEGNNMYINLSRADAHGPTTDIVRAWRNGEGPLEGAQMAGEAAIGILIQSAVLGQISKLAAAAFSDEDIQAKPSRLDKIAPDLASRARNAVADVIPGDSAYKWAELLTESAGLFIPAGVANRFEDINPSVAQLENASLAETVAVLEALGHKFVVARPETATRGAAFDLKDARSEANRQIRATLTASGPEAALDTFARVAQEERRAVERVGEMYHAMIDSGVSPRQAQLLLRDVKLDAKSISNIHNRNYEAEAEDWIRRHSTLLSRNTISNPPGKLKTEEEKKEWIRQAREVKKRVKIMGYNSEENE